MNSTRTWVTPPREPERHKNHSLVFGVIWKFRCFILEFSQRAIGGGDGRQSPRILNILNLCSGSGRARTGAAEDTGHLDELDGGLAGIHLGGRGR